MAEIEPKTREEKLWNGEDIKPLTREEMYIKHIFDKIQTIPDHPITRKEMLMEKAGEGGGGDITIKQLTATENRTYSEEDTAYSPVIVNVPPTPLDDLSVTENGTYNPTSGHGFDEITVNVPLPNNAYLLKSAKDDVVSFSDGSDNFFRTLKAYIKPVQSGSGEPSPSNIRPISGWDECKVTRTKKNLCNWKVSETSNALSISLKPNNYVISAESTLPEGDWYIRFTDSNGEYSYSASDVGLNDWSKAQSGWFYGWYRAQNVPFIVPNGCALVQIGKLSQNGTINAQLEIGTTSTAYEPYNGSTYTIQFTDGSNPLTVYGGILDVVSGVMTVDRAITSYTDSDVSLHTGSISGVTYAKVPKRVNSKTYNNYSSETLTCNKFKNGNGTAIQGGVGLIRSDADTKHYFIGLEPDTTLEEAKEIINGTQLVYERATPQSYQLTAQQVESLLGVNNVWADTGETEVEYFAKEVSA